MRTTVLFRQGEVHRHEGHMEARYRLASLTKQFTAAAVGILAQQGRVLLDGDIATYLPEFKPGVQVQHLLTHSSGLPDYEVYVKERVGDREVRHIMSLHQESLFVPGSRYGYSNGAYCLLAQIVDGLGGFEEQLERFLFAPLGMKGATFRADEVENRVWGTALENGLLRERDQSLTSGTWGDGGIYMNMQEYVHWLGSMVEDGPWNRKQLLKGPTRVINADLSYAWGWFISAEGHLLHTGSSCGFSHAVRFDPVAKEGMVYFSNLADDQAAAFELERSFPAWSPLLPTVLSLTN